MVTDDLSSIFSDVAQQLEPDLAPIINEATRRGRRMKARRRIAIAFSAGATVLAIAVGTTVGAGLAGWSVQGSKPTSPGRHRTANLKPKPHHSPTITRVPQEHGQGMTSKQLLAVLRTLLRTLLPAGEVTYVDPTWPRGNLEVNFNDGQGAVDIQLSVTPTNAIGSDPLVCPNPPTKDEGKRPAGALPISCTTVTLGNGDIIRKGVTKLTSRATTTSSFT